MEIPEVTSRCQPRFITSVTCRWRHFFRTYVCPEHVLGLRWLVPRADIQMTSHSRLTALAHWRNFGMTHWIAQRVNKFALCVHVATTLETFQTCQWKQVKAVRFSRCRGCRKISWQIQTSYRIELIMFSCYCVYGWGKTSRIRCAWPVARYVGLACRSKAFRGRRWFWKSSCFS